MPDELEEACAVGDREHRRGPSRRLLLTGGLAVAVTACTPEEPSPPPSPGTPSLPATTPSIHVRPSSRRVAGSLRPYFHLSVPSGWMNDPQRPVWTGDAWHYWYLYNADYPSGSGTAWRLVTSTDLVHWTDQGVSIPKRTGRDAWSGSAVVDAAGAAGRGKGAVVALVTQPDAQQRQSQFLWSSTDGRSFTAVGSSPVMPNPGRKDFRDPKVVPAPVGTGWWALLAEGDRISFYRSTDLRSWTWIGTFVPANHGAGDLGTLECPDLFSIPVQGGGTAWVLGCGANGSGRGLPATFAYWTGTPTATGFSPDHGEALWLDHGFDFYAAVTFAKPDGSGRHVIGWMNNWAYPNQTPTWAKDRFNGVDSVARSLSAVRRDGRVVLLQQPVTDPAAVGTQRVADQDVTGTRRLAVTGVAYRLDVDLSWTAATAVGLRLRVSRDGKRHIDCGIAGARSFLNRGNTGSPDSTRKRQESQAAFSGTSTHLTVLVDTTTTEVFVGDGEVVHSSQTFPGLDDTAIELFSVGGPCRFSNLVVTQLDASRTS